MKEKMSTYVSIVIPVFNGEKFIGECLESITKLNYPKDNFEVIIVDNGSSDRTLEIIKNFHVNNIKLYFQKIRSSYAARNLGIKNARGDIITFTDVDCIVDKDWLTNIIKPFSDKTVGGIAGEILSGKGNSLVERYSALGEVLSQKRTFNSKFLPFAQTANAAYRRELFNKIGYFDEVISGGDTDYSWRMQLKTDYKLIYAEEAIVFHKHRTDLNGLFKQRFKHGYGSVLIRNKYKDMYNSKRQTSVSGHSGIKSIINCLKKKDYLLLLPIMVNFLGLNLGKIYANILLKTKDR